MEFFTTAPVMMNVGSNPRSSHWPKVRAAFLLQFPRCSVCGRREMLNVHHVEPYHIAPDLELDPANLITLCEGVVNCHLLFGHLMNWSAWNPEVRRDAARWASKIQGRSIKTQEQPLPASPSTIACAMPE